MHPFPPGTHLVAYLRDSGGEDQDLSVDQQLNAITAWCSEHGLILIHIYTDRAAPGSSAIGRDQFQQMIQDLRQSTVDVDGIIIWKYNRFARDIDDAQYYRAQLRRLGYTIHSLNDQIPTGTNGRFFEAAIDWMNQRYLEDLSADSKRGLSHIRQQYGAMPGTPPRGFKREPIHIGTRRDGRPHILHRWVPDPETVPLVQLAFQMRSQGATYRQITETTHLYKSVNCYTTFFSNPIYTGQLHAGGEIIPDYCEPIIDPETWAAVQERQARNPANHRLPATRNPDHPRRSRSTYLLSGILYCAQCGAVMNGTTVQPKKRPQYTHHYYDCSRKHRRGDCKSKAIPREPLEQAVIQTLQDLILHPDAIAERQAQYQRHIDQQHTELAAQRQAIQRQLQTVRRQIANITDAIAEHGARSLIQRLGELEIQENQHLTQLAQINAQATDIDPAHYTPEHTQELVQHIQGLLKNEKNRQRLHQALTALISKIVVDYDRSTKTISGIIHYYHPPANVKKNDFMPIVRAPAGAQTYTHKFSVTSIPKPP